MGGQHDSGAHPLGMRRGVRTHQLPQLLFLGSRYVNGIAGLWTSHT